MSRYLLLFILNLPIALLAITSVVTRYKLNQLSIKKAVFLITAWIIGMIGIALAQPIYEWLFSNNLTKTEPLSLFDVVQITAIVILTYTVARLHARLNETEKMLRDFHQEASILFFRHKQ